MSDPFIAIMVMQKTAGMHERPWRVNPKDFLEILSDTIGIEKELRNEEKGML